MQVNIKYLHPEAKTPTYANPGDACFDLYAAVKEDTVTYDTGIAFEVPEGHAMMVYSRSGHGFNHGAHLCNAVGIIDAPYRGSVKVRFNRPIQAKVGDRIAQAMIVPVERVEFKVKAELTPTERGEGGFGSTGVK